MASWGNHDTCQGDCYLLDAAAVTTSHVDYSQATPSSTAGVFKVALRLGGSTDQTRCTTGQKAMAYLVPQRLYCLQLAVR
jgi:hypothetical protein